MDSKRMGRGITTRLQIHLVRNQRGPLREPRQPQAGNPESDYDQQKGTRAQGQAEEI